MRANFIYCAALAVALCCVGINATAPCQYTSSYTVAADNYEYLGCSNVNAGQRFSLVNPNTPAIVATTGTVNVLVLDGTNFRAFQAGSAWSCLSPFQCAYPAAVTTWSLAAPYDYTVQMDIYVVVMCPAGGAECTFTANLAEDVVVNTCYPNAIAPTVQLPITACVQVCLEWCWATSVAMVIRTVQGLPSTCTLDECTIVSEVFGANCCSSCAFCNNGGSLQQVQEVLFANGFRNTAIPASEVTEFGLMMELSQGRPMILGYNGQSSAHMTVLYGYTQTFPTTYYVMDPWTGYSSPVSFAQLAAYPWNTPPTDVLTVVVYQIVGDLRCSVSGATPTRASSFLLLLITIAASALLHHGDTGK